MDYMLVFMTNGAVFCLDTASEKFITDQNDSFEFARLDKASLVDVKDSKLLTVGEKGKNGMLY